MFIERSLYSCLQEWKRNETRKPLIIRGARQVGKTSLITHFGKSEYENLLHVDLEREHPVRNIFSSGETVSTMIRQLEVIKKIPVTENTLLFLDEIQSSPAAVSVLRYFYEDLPKIPVMAAGSLLEFTLDDDIRSFPVGRVEFLYLYPLSFREYLASKKEVPLLDFLKNVSPDEKIPDVLVNHARGLLREYWLVGGMPDVARHFLEKGSFKKSDEVTENLISTLEEDFRKYRTRFDFRILEFLFRETCKWIGRRVNYSKLGGGTYRVAQVSTGLDLLEKAMLVRRVNPVGFPQFPLQKLGKLHPKISFLDMGLVQSINRISEDILSSPQLSSVYQGGLAEQFVAQEMPALIHQKTKPELFFWSAEKKGSTAEVDYLYPLGGRLIPVEVKAGKGGSLSSLHQYNSLFHPPLSIRIYDGPLSLETIDVKLPLDKRARYPLLNLPLYMISEIPRLAKQIIDSPASRL